MPNNRKRTRGRKFYYTTELETQQTPYGPVTVPGKRKLKWYQHRFLDSRGKVHVHNYTKDGRR